MMFSFFFFKVNAKTQKKERKKKKNKFCCTDNCESCEASFLGLIWTVSHVLWYTYLSWMEFHLHPMHRESPADVNWECLLETKLSVSWVM